MDTSFIRDARLTRSLMALLLFLGCLGVGSCDSPVSPTAVIRAKFTLPAALVGTWHGVSALQVSGLQQGWTLEDMLLRADGSTTVTEYEGPKRTYGGTWFVDLENIIVVRLDSEACPRRGTVDGSTMNLTCSTGSRSWSLVFTKQ